MASSKAVLTVVPDILENESGINQADEFNGVQMPARPCPPGCQCGLHNRLGLSSEEMKEHKRELRTRRYQARIRAEGKPVREGRRCPPGCTCKRHNSEDWLARGESQRRWHHEHPVAPEQTRKHKLKYKFGLSPEQWDQMVDEQGGACYLCEEPLDLDDRRRIHVDHDHSCCRGEKTCGKCIRGLACNECNKGIGNFGDDPQRMMRVAANLAAANARIATRLDGQESPIDIKRAARRREESA